MIKGSYSCQEPLESSTAELRNPFGPGSIALDLSIRRRKALAKHHLQTRYPQGYCHRHHALCHHRYYHPQSAGKAPLLRFCAGILPKGGSELQKDQEAKIQAAVPVSRGRRLQKGRRSMMRLDGESLALVPRRRQSQQMAREQEPQRHRQRHHQQLHRRRCLTILHYHRNPH